MAGYLQLQPTTSVGPLGRYHEMLVVLESRSHSKLGEGVRALQCPMRFVWHALLSQRRGPGLIGLPEPRVRLHQPHHQLNSVLNYAQFREVAQS